MPPPLSSATTLKRIQREIADLKKEDLGDIQLGPSGDNLFLWKATIPGPEGSVYEGGRFDVDINLAHDYPFSAPRMTFRTRIYHMNISERGGICIDILKHNWSPALSLFKVILSLSSLLTDPNPRDPLVPSIATEYVRNREQHDHTARSWTELYARPPPPPPPLIVPSAPISAAARAKGKARAPGPVAASSHPQSTSSTPQPSLPNASEPILIEDSDDEGSHVTSTRGSTGVKRKRDSMESTTPIDLVSGEQEDTRSRRRRTSGGTRSEQREVIVIED